MASVINGSNGPNMPGNKANSSTKSNMRNLSSARNSDTGSKPQEEQPPRPQTQTNAWSKGSPLIHRSTSGPQINGISEKGSGPATAKSTQPQQLSSNDLLQSLEESDTPEQHCTDRLLSFYGTLVGKTVNIRTKSRETFSGVFTGANHKEGVATFTLTVTKRSQPTSNGVGTNKPARTDSFVGPGPDHSVNFKSDDIVDLIERPSTTKESSPVRKVAGSSFKTDADIAGGNTGKERELEKWTPDPTTSGASLSLGRPTNANWNQFEVNERLYGSGTDYNEELYTTPINRNDPNYRQQVARADRLAKEIERGPALNAHIAEERGQSRPDDSGRDEEDLYSGVQRDVTPLQMGSANAYLPPSRRTASTKDIPYSKAHTTEKEEKIAPAPKIQPAIPTQQVRHPTAAPAVPRAPAPSISHGSTAPVRPLAQLEAPTCAVPNGVPQAAPAQNGPAAKNTTTSHTGLTKEKTDQLKMMLNDYHNFAMEEKTRMQNMKREDQRNRKAKKEADRESRTADLKRFAANFKLDSVPSDEILPILAKDPEKQKLITQKAEQDRIAKAKEKADRQAAQKSYEAKIAAEKESDKPSQDAERKPQAAKARVGESAVESLQKSSGAIQTQGLRSSRPNKDTPNRILVDPRPGQSRVSSGQGQSSGRSPHVLPQRPLHGMEPEQPLSPNRLNVQATEFRPNANAPAFRPPALSAQGSNASSRPGTRAAHSPQQKPKRKFWANRRPVPKGERLDIEKDLNPFIRMYKEFEEKGEPETEKNRPIPPPFTTDPLWRDPNLSGKNWREFYVSVPPSPTPSVRARVIQQQQQQQQPNAQMPFPMQAGGPSGASMMPMQYHPQAMQQPMAYQGRHPSIPGMGPQFVDPRAVPPSPNAMMQSPHLAQPGFAYPGPVPAGAQLMYPQGFPQYAPVFAQAQYAHLRQHPGQTPVMMAPGNPQMFIQTPNGPQIMSVPATPQMGFQPPGSMYGSPHQPQAHFGSPMMQQGGGFSGSAYPSPRQAPAMLASHQSSRQNSRTGGGPNGGPPMMGMSPHQNANHLYNGGGHPGYSRQYSNNYNGSPRMNNRFPQHNGQHQHSGPPPMQGPPHHNHGNQSYNSGNRGGGGNGGQQPGSTEAPSTPGSGLP